MGLHLGAVDQAPSVVEIHMVEQPLDRALAEGVAHLLDFGHLLGQMHMHGSNWGEVGQLVEAAIRHGAEAVGGNAQPGVIGKLGKRRLRPVEQFGETIGVIAEPDLALTERSAIAAALLIENRQAR